MNDQALLWIISIIVMSLFLASGVWYYVGWRKSVAHRFESTPTPVRPEPPAKRAKASMPIGKGAQNYKQSDSGTFLTLKPRSIRMRVQSAEGRVVMAAKSKTRNRA